ncbi:MAG: bifunctional phosphopantothenoylcysteine decarboxylase/phosphopantothenate--cysteine ligase CoaBC [Methanobacteriales archaeon HGW-Methanobacteriales-1]|jgi:phosphopantothenoylcysteine decarboxylase/phosphopantothenate--cysteine ligase|nr:MAG: bifunctional phosphopantothenoylcysteine decarboxylase/phosphopantothenate--cysteine ligase CoaBC [Methanobacteriales archaeon HGW-Methanobacteriales-1]
MEIVLCVTGSVAAVETVKLARELRRQGADVKCFMSDDACHIIHPYALEFATGQEVVLELTGKIEHVKYAQADLVLVAPATANVISKFAYKMADNPINTLLITALGHDTPIVMVPSMHDSMYRSIEENIHKLEEEGINFVLPRLDEGKAKFPYLEDIVLQALRQINNSENDLKGKKVLISAGGTYEAIDPIRGISNRSSGKMGIEIAKEAFIRGAEVIMLVGEVSVPVPQSFESIKTVSSKEMNQKALEIIPEFDIFVSSAAVSDFSPSIIENSKISSDNKLELELKPNPKIINQIKHKNPDIFLVGFKAEYNISESELIDSAKKQMVKSGTDLVVANDVSVDGSGFGSDKNKVMLVDDEVQNIPLSSKKEIAQMIWDRILLKID